MNTTTFAQQVIQAENLRLDGYTLRDIAAEMGFNSPSSVQRLLGYKAPKRVAA